MKFKFHQSNSIRVSCAFDVKEDIVGRIVDGIPVYPLDNMVEQIKLQQIEIAILTLPAQQAQQVVDQLAAAGIKGILNFTAARLTAPEDVIIQSVDLTNELQTLIYFYITIQTIKRLSVCEPTPKARPKILLLEVGSVLSLFHLNSS